MGFLSSIFGGGSQANAYDPLAAQQITAQSIQAPEMNAQQNNAIAHQGNILGQQQNFANALAAQASGQGPSVANEQLKQALQQQQAQAASMAASQRGVNPALAMRTAMEQQGQNSQAAAQASALGRAQEALGAQGMLGNTLQGMMGSQQQAQSLGTQQQQLAQQANMANQAALLEAGRANQSADLQAQAGTRQLGQQQNQAQGNVLGGIVGTIGHLATMMSPAAAAAMNQGGMVRHYADGGVAGDSGPVSSLGQSLSGIGGTAISGPLEALSGMKTSGPFTFDSGSFGGKSKGSAKAPSADDVTSSIGSPVPMGFASGGRVQMASKNLKQGGKVSGQAKVSGDSLKNDTVPAMLSPKEIVLPRSVTMAKDAPERAAKFVAAVLAKNGMRAKK